MFKSDTLDITGLFFMPDKFFALFICIKSLQGKNLENVEPMFIALLIVLIVFVVSLARLPDVASEWELIRKT